MKHVKTVLGVEMIDVSIENYGVIDKFYMSMGEGMNLLYGDYGKSTVIQAINYLNDLALRGSKDTTSGTFKLSIEKDNVKWSFDGPYNESLYYKNELLYIRDFHLTYLPLYVELDSRIAQFLDFMVNIQIPRLSTIFTQDWIEQYPEAIMRIKETLNVTEIMFSPPNENNRCIPYFYFAGRVKPLQQYDLSDKFYQTLQMLITLETAQPGSLVMIDDFGDGLTAKLLSAVLKHVQYLVEKKQLYILVTSASPQLFSFFLETPENVFRAPDGRPLLDLIDAEY